MTAQRGLLALAVVAGLLAGVLYHLGTQRVPVVIAAQPLAPGRAIAPADVDTRWLPPDALPASALSDPRAAVGRFPRGPVWPGQLILATGIADSSAAFEGGVALPTGYRAIAVPIAAHTALGGAILPGARVDVIAVSSAGAEPAALAELLIEAALVIDVRGEHGGSFEREVAGSGLATRERLGSVVIAVGPSEELLIAERITRGTFVLALVTSAR